jgi:glycosyltransferase involved in cell wall biosynthesis
MTEISDQPLVSIVVITYNSAKYVLETLESAKSQTYENIELIVTDDNSADETVELCKKWIDANKDRFTRTALVSSDTNTGIPANINRGINISSGYWIKCIAGDDLMTRECLTELINYISISKEDIRILYSDVIRFSGNSIANVENVKFENARFCSGEVTAKEQYEILLRANRVLAASLIIRRDLLMSFNGFDERFRLLEDWPLWLKVTNEGYKIYYLDKPLVYYRIHDNNLSMTINQNFLYHPVSKINIIFKEKELIPRLPFIERWGMRHDIMGIKTCFFLGNNKRNPFTRFVYKMFNISNPFYNYLRIKKLFGIT